MIGKTIFRRNSGYPDEPQQWIKTICNETYLELIKEFPDLGTTNRFDTFEEVVNAGIEKWKELNLDCPFISLFEGEKYTANSYEPSTTVILYK